MILHTEYADFRALVAEYGGLPLRLLGVLTLCTLLLLHHRPMMRSGSLRVGFKIVFGCFGGILMVFEAVLEYFGYPFMTEELEEVRAGLATNTPQNALHTLKHFSNCAKHAETL